MKTTIIKIATTTLFISTVTVAQTPITDKKGVGAKEASLEIKSQSKEWKSKYKFFGFSQIGVRLGDGATADNQNGDYKFEADRIRLGWKYFSGPIAGKVFLDFVKEGKDNSGIGVPDLIKDAFISYKFNSSAIVKAGVIKTPVGMGFTIPGWNLDVIKRGFDKRLAFERGFGLMLSGRAIGGSAKVNGLEMGHEKPYNGFGYDIMIAGQAGRSGAVVGANSGDDNAYMGRIMYDRGQALHLETSYGISKSAGGIDIDDSIICNQGTEDYKVFNFGIDSHFERSNIKAEYYNVQNIRGDDDWTMATLALTGTYYFSDVIEGAVKHIIGSEGRHGVDSDVSNTYLGINYYINPKNAKMDRKARKGRNQHRIQLNYVLADGDTNSFKGVGSFFRDDTILVQYQFKF